MKLNYYCSFESKNAKRWVPGVKALNLTRERWRGLTQDAFTATLIKEYREGNKEAKTKLPAVCWTGYTDEGNSRKIENMTPTGLYIIDIDHIQVQGDKGQGDKVREVWENILEKMPLNLVDAVRLVHITPSGKGLRLVMQCTENFPTLGEHMQWLDEIVHFNEFGDFDTAVKDISRLSFVPQACDILYESDLLWSDEGNYNPIINGNVNVNGNKDTPLNSLNQREARLEPLNQKRYEQQEIPNGGNGSQEWKPLRSHYAGYKYRGTLLTTIIDKYLEVYGEPEQGEKHNFYNKMVRDFRNICDNDPLVLHDLLPRFGGDNAEEYRATLSQCQSICRSNNNGSIPREFFMFLAKNGFYKRRNGNGNWNGNLVDDEEEEEVNVPVNVSVEAMPTPPPIIKELISCAPKDFKLPAINALLPILGTLTSYVRAEDEQTAKTISTSFFSVVYAPPSSGKSFMERYTNWLLRDILIRDEVNDARDAVFARKSQQKSANDKGEKLPATSIRIMEAKNSEAEFLEKQRNNKGHHMFTYCAEIDQWRKGIRAAGGNKDDMVRIAWENGFYGQNYKSTNTFKGKVQLFWNVLLAGTDDQVAAYFKNVTNGLVTRCSFMHIDNQQFQYLPPAWKKLNAKQKQKVNNFIDKCDAMTYAEPLNVNMADIYAVDDDDFDKEVPWQYDFKPLQYVDISWIIPTCNEFQKEQTRRAQIESDFARDTFRRRVGDRGKRIALLCTQFYNKPMTQKDKELCAKWIKWWMEQDLEAICKVFGEKYTQAIQETALPAGTKRKTVLERLPDEFSIIDVRKVADILGYQSEARLIVHNWIKAGVVEKIDKTHWKKVYNKTLKIKD